MRTSSQFFGKESDVMLSVPKSVRKEADSALYLRSIGFKGATETGWKRANQLSREKSISIEDVRFMRNWYARHIYTSYPGFMAWVNEGRPLSPLWHNKHAILSWLTWGGTPGLRWMNSANVIEKLNVYFEKDYGVIKTKK